MPISADTNTDDSRTLQVADPMDHANEPELNGKQMLVFRYRLWMLFLLFIPVAIYAKRLGQEPGLVYMESRSLFGRTATSRFFSQIFPTERRLC